MYQLRLRTSDCRWNWRRRSGRGFCSGRPAEGRKGCSFWAPRKTKKEGKCDFNLRKQDGVSVSVHDAQISQLNSGDGRESPGEYSSGFGSRVDSHRLQVAVLLRHYSRRFQGTPASLFACSFGCIHGVDK